MNGKLWWQMYWPYRKKLIKKKKKKKSTFLLKVGDKVRISLLRSSFQWEYDNKWSYEIFKIIRRYIRQDQPIYCHQYFLYSIVLLNTLQLVTGATGL